MIVLIDTNVLLDFLLGREPYFSNADKIIKLCADRKIQGLWQRILFQIYFTYYARICQWKQEEKCCSTFVTF